MHTFPLPASYAWGGVGWRGWVGVIMSLLLCACCVIRYDGFSCTSSTTSSYVKISLSWCYVTRTSLDFMLRYAQSKLELSSVTESGNMLRRPSPNQQSIMWWLFNSNTTNMLSHVYARMWRRRCRLSHCGKVWLTCAINMAKTKFEAAPSLEKNVRTLRRVIENCICRKPFQGFWELF